jgi:hypothetical protein
MQELKSRLRIRLTGRGIGLALNIRYFGYFYLKISASHDFYRGKQVLEKKQHDEDIIRNRYAMIAK